MRGFYRRRASIVRSAGPAGRATETSIPGHAPHLLSIDDGQRRAVWCGPCASPNVSAYSSRPPSPS